MMKYVPFVAFCSVLAAVSGTPYHGLTNVVRASSPGDLRADWMLVEDTTNEFTCPGVVQHTTWGRVDGVVTLAHNTIRVDGARCESTGLGRILQLYDGLAYGDDLEPVEDAEELPEELVELSEQLPVMNSLIAAREYGEAFLFGYDNKARVCEGTTKFPPLTAVLVLRPFRMPLEIPNLVTPLVRGRKYMLMIPRFKSGFCLYDAPVIANNGSPTGPMEPAESDGPMESEAPLESMGPMESAEPMESNEATMTDGAMGSEEPMIEFEMGGDGVVGVGGKGAEAEGMDMEEEEGMEDIDGMADEDSKEEQGEPIHTVVEADEYDKDIFASPVEVFDLDNEPAGEEVSLVDDIASCFPAHATVQLSSGATRRMDALRVGDMVQVSANQYSAVFAFSHADASAYTPFVRLHTASGAALSASSGHYVYANGAAVAASRVRVGDKLRLANGGVSIVVGVEVQWMRGLYNPQTLQGDVVVDGVVATTYTTAVQPVRAVALLAPVRALFRVTGKDGLGGWVRGGAPRWTRVVGRLGMGMEGVGAAGKGALRLQQV